MRERRRQRRRLRKGERGHLIDLQKGQVAKHLGLQNEIAAERRRLNDMGITSGVEIKIKKIAPLGDPIDIELRGYELCIRKKDMETIDIEVIE